jgi:hypothetical protein
MQVREDERIIWLGLFGENIDYAGKYLGVDIYLAVGLFCPIETLTEWSIL